MVSVISEKMITLFLVLHWIGSILCESIPVGEQTNFSPCSFTDGILQCDSKTIKNNQNFQFQTPLNTKIQRLEILNFPFAEIPSHYFTPLANDLVAITILSTVPIKSINQIAFSGCSKVTYLEIRSHPTTDEKTIELNEVFRDVISLKELKLFHLNFLELRLGYLQKLKSIYIENSNLNSISVDTFQSNLELSTLNIVGLKNAVTLIDQFTNWPAGIVASISTLKLENCNLKIFPRFSSNFAKNLTYLSLAKNPIEKITINDTVYLGDLQNLVLSSTKLENRQMGGLKTLQKLKSLDLSDIATIKDLPIEIEQMEFLESINFDMATSLTQLSITLPASIRKLSALQLKKPIIISSNFLSKCNKLNLLNLNSLDTRDIKFLVDNVNVFKQSLQVLNLDDSVVLKPDLWTMIGHLSKLEILYLNKVNIDSIPDQVLNNLVSLKKLFLSRNTLTYDSINTAGFQNISRHLTTLDLSYNQLINLPPCTFHSLSSLANVNLLETGIDCDCNMLWLWEKIRSSPVVYPLVNFTCAAGRNAKRALYQLKAADLVQCSSTIKRCLPLTSGFYEIPFNIVYAMGDRKFRIDNINGSHLRFMFDYMKVNVKHENKSYHSDIDKYELNMSWIVMNHEMQTNTFTVCLTLVRDTVEYDYAYNCRSVSGPLVNQAAWTIMIGVLIGATVVMVIVIVLVVVCIRRKRVKKKPTREEDLYSECSSEYSEPDETYQNPDQYTEITSNEEYTMDQKEAIKDASLPFNRSLPGSYYPNRNLHRLAMPSKSVDGGLDVSYITSSNRFNRFNKSRGKSSKRRPEFASLHNLNKDVNSLPRKYHGTVRASLPQTYLSRDLPIPPDGIPMQPYSSGSPPPKPKFPSTDIKNLLSNADNHLNYFLNYASNGSLCTDESTNHPHSGDSGLGVSKLSNHSQNRVCQDNSVII